MTRVVITGGNGFIASHLADRLVDLGDSVTLVDLDFDVLRGPEDARRVRGDVREYRSLVRALEGAEVVFHLAAVSRVAWGQENPFNCWRTNAFGTVNVLEASRRVRSTPVVFYASSREVYGEPVYLPVDEGHPRAPVSVYGRTKNSGESACEAYRAADRPGRAVPSVVFRFSNVYGSERDLPSRVIPKFLSQALRNEEIVLYGGDQVLDFSYVGDTVDGIVRAYTAVLDQRPGVLGETFHFVTGRGVPIVDLARAIVDLTGSSSPIAHGDANGFEVRSFVGNPDKARRVLGYAPRVRLEEGLKILHEKWLQASPSDGSLFPPDTVVHGA